MARTTDNRTMRSAAPGRALPLLLGGLLAIGCSTQLNGNPPLDDDPPPGPDWDDSTSGTPADDGEFNCGEEAFTLTESQETFEVPEDVLYMKVKAWGAGANGVSGVGTGTCGYPDGGLGGYTEAIFAVAPGTPLSIVVGQRGRDGITGESPERFGFGARGGGGLTGIFTGTDLVTEDSSDRALIIAGGGGSAGWRECRPGGTGNHPQSGSQSSMFGQFGASDGVNGGGGGYMGGDGGADKMPGKGGQGFLADKALEPVMLWSEPGDQEPPRTDDPDYDGSAGSTEAPGLLIIQFACEYPGIGDPPDDPPQVD